MENLPEESAEIDGDGEDVQPQSSGGPFTEKQIAEIRQIVDAMNQELEHKAKEWDRPLESVLRIANLSANTRERRSAGNPWNAFHHAYEKDPDINRPHHEYVENIIQPAYRKLISEHGGEDSDEWKKKAMELVEQHNASKAAQAASIALLPAAMGKVIKQTTKRWMDDLKWMATMNIHGFCAIFSGVPDEAASKHNAVFTGSPAMKAWLDESFPKDSTLLKMIHSHILVYQGQQRLHQNEMRKVPKTMHAMRKEISEELQDLLKPFVGHVPRIPWATLARFLANNHLKIENWVTESDFPNLTALDISVVRTDSWKKLWRAFFQPKDDSTKIRILQLPDDVRLPDDTAIVMDQNSNVLVTAGQAYEDAGEGEPGGDGVTPGVDTTHSNTSQPNSSRAKKRDLDVSGGPPRKKRRANSGRKKGPRGAISREIIEEEEEEAISLSLNPSDSASNSEIPTNVTVPINWAVGADTTGMNDLSFDPPLDPLLWNFPDLMLGLGGSMNNY